MPLQEQQTTTTKLEGRLNRLLKYNEDQKKIKSCPYASPRESFVWWGDVSMFVSAWLTSNVCQDNADQQDEARRSDDTLALTANMRRGMGGEGRGTETNKIENSRNRRDPAFHYIPCHVQPRQSYVEFCGFATPLHFCHPSFFSIRSSI